MIQALTGVNTFKELLQQEQFNHRTKLLIGVALFFIAGLSFSLSFSLSNATHAATDSVTHIHSFAKTPESEIITWNGAEQGISYGTTTSYGTVGIATGTSTNSDNTEPLLQIQLTGLHPGTTYHYRIGLNGIDHTFRTMPLPQ